MPRFIPTEEIKLLTRGSFEHLVSKLDDLIRENSEVVFGAKTETHLLGTFPGYAIVASAEGDCARVKYEQVGTKVRIAGVEKVEVPSYDEKGLSGFLKTEAEKVLDLFNAGSITEASARLRGLLALSGKVEESVVSQESAAEAWISALNRARPWERLYEARKEKIHRSIWAEMKQLEQDRLRPKFRKLYDGSIQESDLESYRDLVVENIETVRTRTEALISRLRASYEGIRLASSRIDSLDSEDGLTNFTAFSEDLVESLDKINTIATESPLHVSRVDLLGRLHDKMTERLFSMEVTGLFVSQMATRLSDPK